MEGFWHVILLSISPNRFKLVISFSVWKFTQRLFFQSWKGCLAKGVSSRDSITINHGNSVISFSELDSERFCLGFLVCICYVFLPTLSTDLVLNYQPQSPDSVGKFTRQNIHSSWLRWMGIYQLVHSCQKRNFKAQPISDFQYSKPALKLNSGPSLLLAWLTLSHCLLAPLG